MLSSHGSNQAPIEGRIDPAARALVPSSHMAPGPVPQRRDIAEKVSDRLAESAYFVLRNVWCDYHEGVLCLRGRVPTYYLKQVAQTIACQVEGVEECMNRIEVTVSAIGPPATS